jgi:hypothetical protein
MLPDSFVNRHKSYLATYGHPASTAGVEHYRAHMRGGAGGAYDAAPPRRARLQSFEEVYRVRLGPKGETIALDQHDPQRDGPLLFDRDPPPQRLVETDAEPTDHEGFPANRAPPAGLHDEPRLAQDPIQSERQRRAMGAAASGHSNLQIPKSVGERFLHGDQVEVELPSERTREPESVRAGQQGGDQEQHLDEPQDEKLIRRVLKKLGFEDDAVEEAIARDRAGRRRMAGDAALSGRSFCATYPDARSLVDGLPAFTPKVFVHRSRGP